MESRPRFCGVTHLGGIRRGCMRRLAVLLLMSFVCLSGSNLYAYSGGTGTSGDPFLITTAAELNSIGATPALWASYFKLAANINMSGYTGTSYNIIGNYSQHFTGGFDGNGFVISNLTYTAAVDTDCVGMFGYTDHALIKNVQLVNVSISSVLGEDVGGLIAYQDYGTTTNCSTTGAVSGGTAVGGLVGHYYGATPGQDHELLQHRKRLCNILPRRRAGWICPRPDQLLLQHRQCKLRHQYQCLSRRAGR